MASTLFGYAGNTTTNKWNKMERPGVLLENGHVTHVTWAVSDGFGGAAGASGGVGGGTAGTGGRGGTGGGGLGGTGGPSSGTAGAGGSSGIGTWGLWPWWRGAGRLVRFGRRREHNGRRRRESQRLLVHVGRRAAGLCCLFASAWVGRSLSTVPAPRFEY